MNLYQPEKYKVFSGNGKSFGFCTVWNEAEAVFNKSEIIREKTAILGTLYSRQGVNIIIRNLALNPQIKKFFIWGNGGLSNTQFGLMGKSLIEKIWKEGIDSDGFVKGTKFKLEKEIDVEIVKKIISNVELIDMSHLSLEEAEKRINEEEAINEPYMESIRFPDAVLEKTETFPSEEVGWLVRGKTIIEAWLRVSDIKFLKDLLGFKLVYIEADVEKRFQRISVRGENSDDNEKTFEQFKKELEQESETQIRGLKDGADYIINNNGLIKELCNRVDEIIKQVCE